MGLGVLFTSLVNDCELNLYELLGFLYVLYLANGSFNNVTEQCDEGFMVFWEQYY